MGQKSLLSPLFLIRQLLFSSTPLLVKNKKNIWGYSDVTENSLDIISFSSFCEKRFFTMQII